MGSMTKIIKCKCKHKFQDDKYGDKKRVHNYGEKEKTWRCTVCNDTKS